MTIPLWIFEKKIHLDTPADDFDAIDLVAVDTTQCQQARAGLSTAENVGFYDDLGTGRETSDRYPDHAIFPCIYPGIKDPDWFG